MSARRGALFSVSLASGLAVFLAAQGFFRSLVFNPHFLVDQIELRWQNPADSPVKGYRLRPPTSIFQIRLEEVARALTLRHPTAEVEAVRRVLPNRLIASMRPRRVIAQIRADRYYPLSDDGTVVSPGRPNPWPHLPIFFIGNPKGPFRLGQNLGSPDFFRALELLALAHRERGTLDHAVSYIKVKGKDLTLTLSSGLEIRFTQERLRSGWEQLLELIAQRRQVLEKARYLDLRFEDLVIGDGRPKASGRS